MNLYTKDILYKLEMDNKMKTYRAFDNTGQHITFTADSPQEALEKAQDMQHAPVKVVEVKGKGKAK